MKVKEGKYQEKTCKELFDKYFPSFITKPTITISPNADSIIIGSGTESGSYQTKAKIYAGVFAGFTVREIDHINDTVLISSIEPKIDILINVNVFNEASLSEVEDDNILNDLGESVLDKLTSIENKVKKMLSMEIIDDQEFAQTYDVVDEILRDIYSHKDVFNEELKNRIKTRNLRIS